MDSWSKFLRSYREDLWDLIPCYLLVLGRCSSLATPSTIGPCSICIHLTFIQSVNYTYFVTELDELSTMNVLLCKWESKVTLVGRSVSWCVVHRWWTYGVTETADAVSSRRSVDGHSGTLHLAWQLRQPAGRLPVGGLLADLRMRALYHIEMADSYLIWQRRLMSLTPS